MDFLALKVFIDVVDAGSFSKAAREMNRSKAMVSRTISDLENDLQTRLLNRTTRQLSLTDVGARFAAEARDILARAEALKNSMREEDGTPRGLLRVSGPRSFGDTDLSRMVAQFIRTYPEVQVELLLEDRFVDLVAEGFDVAIRIADLPDSSLISKRLAASRQMVCATPACLKRYGRPSSPKELAELPCIIDTVARNGQNWMFQNGGKRETVRVSGPLTVSGATAVRTAALEGVGFAYLPGFAVVEEILKGELEPVLTEFEVDGHGVYALYPHKRHLSAKVRSFIDFLSEQFANKAECFSPRGPLKSEKGQLTS